MIFFTYYISHTLIIYNNHTIKITHAGHWLSTLNYNYLTAEHLNLSTLRIVLDDVIIIPYRTRKPAAVRS